MKKGTLYVYLNNRILHDRVDMDSYFPVSMVVFTTPRVSLGMQGRLSHMDPPGFKAAVTAKTGIEFYMDSEITRFSFSVLGFGLEISYQTGF